MASRLAAGPPEPERGTAVPWACLQHLRAWSAQLLGSLAAYHHANLSAVVTVRHHLQDSEHGNAGHGSNLSFNGLVECDASVMAGDGAFGAIAAAPGKT